MRGQNYKQGQSIINRKSTSLSLYVRKTQNRTAQILDHLCLYYLSSVLSHLAFSYSSFKTAFSRSPPVQLTVTSLITHYNCYTHLLFGIAIVCLKLEKTFDDLK